MDKEKLSVIGKLAEAFPVTDNKYTTLTLFQIVFIGHMTYFGYALSFSQASLPLAVQIVIPLLFVASNICLAVLLLRALIIRHNSRNNGTRRYINNEPTKRSG